MSASNRDMGPPKPLTPREQDILEQIDGLRAKLKEFDHRPAEEIDQRVKDEAIAQIFHEYHDYILKAIRARLDEHPLVEEEIRDFLEDRIDWLKEMGQRDYLRRARRGLEAGVKRPLSQKQAELLNAVEELRWGDKMVSSSVRRGEDELSSPLTFEEIFRRAGKGEILNDPENPPYEKKPRSWQEVLDILVMRELIKKMRLKTFMDKIKRLDPTII
jgi:hypothetical protein